MPNDKTGTVWVLDRTLTWTYCDGGFPGVVVGECREAGLSMEAHSVEELWSLAREATEILLRDLDADGELDGWLAERGWTLAERQSAPNPTFRFEVPITMSSATGCAF